MDAGLRGNSASESTASIPSWVRSLEYVRVWKLPFYPAPIFEGTLTEGQTHFWLKVSRHVDIAKARGLKEVPGGERMSSAGVARFTQLSQGPARALATILLGILRQTQTPRRRSVSPPPILQQCSRLVPWPGALPRTHPRYCSLYHFCDWQEMSPEVANSISCQNCIPVTLQNPLYVFLRNLH